MGGAVAWDGLGQDWAVRGHWLATVTAGVKSGITPLLMWAFLWELCYFLRTLWNYVFLDDKFYTSLD